MNPIARDTRLIGLVAAVLGLGVVPDTVHAKGPTKRSVKLLVHGTGCEHEIEAKPVKLEKAKQGTKQQIAFYGSMILFLLMLYVLSVGPAVRIHRAVKIPAVTQVMDVVYRPLGLLAGSGADCGFVRWYIELWNPMR